MENALSILKNHKDQSLDNVFLQLRFIETHKQQFFEFSSLCSESDNIVLYNHMKTINDSNPLMPQDFALLFKIRLWLLNIIKRQQSLQIASPHKWQFPSDIIPDRSFSKKIVLILPKCWPSEKVEIHFREISIRAVIRKLTETGEKQPADSTINLVYSQIRYNKNKHQLYIYDLLLRSSFKQQTFECFSLLFRISAPFMSPECSNIETSSTVGLLVPQNSSLTQSFQWYAYLARLLKVSEMNLQNMIQQLVIWCVRHLNQDCKIYQLAEFELTSFLNFFKQNTSDELLFQSITSRFKLLQYCPDRIKSLYAKGLLFFVDQFEAITFLTNHMISKAAIIFIDKDKNTKCAWYDCKNESHIFINVQNIDLMNLEDITFIKKSFGITQVFQLNRLNGKFHLYDIVSQNLIKFY